MTLMQRTTMWWQEILNGGAESFSQRLLSSGSAPKRSPVWPPVWLHKKLSCAARQKALLCGHPKERFGRSDNRTLCGHTREFFFVTRQQNSLVWPDRKLSDPARQQTLFSVQTESSLVRPNAKARTKSIEHRCQLEDSKASVLGKSTSKCHGCQ